MPRVNFDVDRTDLHHVRVVTSAPPADLADGEVELALESFAFTSNNISYAVAGDMLDYWGFFPAEAPWGRIPVMGIGRVVRSQHPGIEVGGRYFGFYPMAEAHVVQASPSAGGFVDRAAHRSGHAPAYRSFNLVDLDPAYDPTTEGQYLIARGLFITSFLVDDFLAEHQMFGATDVIVTSASSRTSIALAHRLHARGGVRVVGLTAARNAAFVASLGLYDTVLAYDQIDTLPTDVAHVIVDMAGNADVLSRVHRHLGDQLMYSCRVGATHWEAGGSAKDLPGPTPTFFFAPSQIKQRSAEWGRDVFEARVGEALAAFLDHAAGWMTIRRSSGAAAVEAVYRATLAGESDPAVGHILSMSIGEPPSVLADDIPVAYTPEGGWTEMPPPFLTDCTEPLVAGAPDLRGTWKAVGVRANDADLPDHPIIGKVQRIEQAGDRLIVTAGGIVHDMRCDGTVERGVHDVAEFDKVTPITVVATYENGVHVLRPVGMPIEVTRHLEGDEMVWNYVGFTARLVRVPSA